MCSFNQSIPINHSILLNICFTICLGLLSSQTYSIYGEILDYKTSLPLENVNVYIANSDIGTSTDTQGYFNLFLNNQLDDSSDIKIKLIGYKQITIQFDYSKTIIDLGEILLRPESLEIESVHIHSHSESSSQISDISLSGQKLNDNFTSNIATTLSNQPNIGVYSFGSVTSKPVLRGYSGDRFLLTKDGKIIGDLSQSSIDHVITLDMTEVSDIEVIRGPKSLIYGSNTIGGVINTTIKGNPRIRAEKFIKNILIGGESFNNGLYGNIALYIPNKDKQLNFIFNNRHAGNQKSQLGELENTYSNASNYKLAFTKYNKYSYINFTAENFIMNYGIPPSEEGHINGVDIELIKNTFQINYHQDISYYSFTQFDINYNFIDYEHKEFENNLDYFSVALSKNTHNIKFKLESSNSIFGSEVSYKQFLPSGFYWTPRTNHFDLSLYSFNEKEYNNCDLLYSFRAGYLIIQPEQENIFFSNLDFREVNNKNFNYFSSSIGLRKTINTFQINSWIMQTMRAPKLEELFSDGPHLGTYSYEIGEPNLKLEKIYGNETSIIYNNERFTTSLSTFFNYSPYYYQMSKMGNCNEEYIPGESHPCSGEDFIEWGSGSSGWLYKYKTDGVESIIKGLEFNLGYFYKRFSIKYDFSLVRGDDITNNIPLSYMNPDKHILIIEHKNKLFSQKIRVSHINDQNRLGEFETYTQSSFLVDFILSYSNKNQNITIQLNNLLDQEYYNHLSKIKDIMPEAGRNIILNYKILF